MREFLLGLVCCLVAFAMGSYMARTRIENECKNFGLFISGSNKYSCKTVEK